MHGELERMYGEAAGGPRQTYLRLWATDPYTRGYVTQWWPGDVLRVGPLHGTHDPPFYVCGSDQWVAGYMEGAVRTGAPPPRRRSGARAARRSAVSEHVEADVASSARESPGCGRDGSSSRRDARSSCSRHATGSAVGSGTPRSAERRTSSAVSGSLRTSRMHALLPELGIELFAAYRDGDDVYVDESGRSHRYTDHATPLGSASEKRARGRRGEAGRAREGARSRGAVEPPGCSRARHRHVRGLAPRGGGGRPGRDLLRSYLADGFLTKPAHSFSLLQGLWVIAGAGGTYELFASEQCLADRVVGGSQLIPFASPRSSATA